MRLRWLFQLFYQQVLIKVIKRCCHRHHLLEMLTKVNKRIADEQRGSPNGVATVQVPYLTHTLRAKVLLTVGMNQLMKRIWKECIWKEKNFEDGCGIVRLDSSNTRLNFSGYNTSDQTYIRNGYTHCIPNELYLEIHSDARRIELIPKSKGRLLIWRLQTARFMNFLGLNSARLSWMSIRLAWIALKVSLFRVTLGNGNGIYVQRVCSLQSAVCGKCHAHKHGDWQILRIP